MPDLLDLAPIIAAAIFGGLFAFQTPSATTELEPPLTFTQVLERSNPIEACTLHAQRIAARDPSASRQDEAFMRLKCTCKRDQAIYMFTQNNITYIPMLDAAMKLYLDPAIQKTMVQVDSPTMAPFYAGELDEELGFSSEELAEALHLVAKTPALADQWPAPQACRAALETTG